MNRKCWLLLLSLVQFIIGLCQDSSEYATVLFAKNKYNISAENKSLLIGLTLRIKLRSDYKIFINGHADSDADSSYNKELSFKRSLAVRALLIENGVDSTLITTRALGEDQPLVANTTPIGKAKNRRVEVFVLYEQKLAEQIPEINNTFNRLTICDGDTLLELNDVYRLHLSKCDWEVNKNCLRVIKNFRYNYKIKESWLKKHIGFKNYRKYIAIEPHYDFTITSCNHACFEKPVKLFIPQYQAKGLDIKNKYSQKRNNNGRSTNRVFRRDKIGDSAFYSTHIYCPFDCGFDNRCQHLVKLKGKNGIDIISYSYFERSGTSYFDSLVEVKPPNPKILIDEYPHTWFNSLKLLYKSDTISVKNIFIDIFPNNHRKIKTRGSKYDKKYIMFIPFRKVYKCGHYKLYKIRPRDLKKLKNYKLEDLLE
jgi:hypothetical protein